ncbi:MAG TPA: hypothetical protein VG742_12215 [Dongiaceae bacterium]|nr:hypothetical protein [Dongiaceae bacterium]
MLHGMIGPTSQSCAPDARLRDGSLAMAESALTTDDSGADHTTTDRSTADKVDHWRRDLGWLVRLFLILFAGFSLASWPDLLFKMDAYEAWIGSTKGCRLNAAHCSWNSYLLAQVIPSLLAIAVCLFVSWSVVAMVLRITG